MAKNLPVACIFVASLNSLKSSSDLQHSVYQTFSKYGKITSVKVFKHDHGPYSFVQFEDAVSAQSVLGKSIIIDGRQVRIEPAKVNRTLILESHLDTIHDALAEYDIENMTHLNCIYTQDYSGYSLIKFKYREDAQKCFLHFKQSIWDVDWFY